MQVIELFRGPLDGLKFEVTTQYDVQLEFAYSQVDSKNYKLSHDPSPLQPPNFYETYRITGGKSQNDHIVYEHQKSLSHPPTGG